MKECNVIIVGVGGQGTILISELLGKAAIHDHISVIGSEIIGASQRGGPVNSMLRLGGTTQGPQIPHGKADIMIAMELAEALRNILYMSKSGFIFLNPQRIMPLPVLIGKATYPDSTKIVEKLEENSSRLIILDAAKLAEEAGSSLSANFVMLGAVFATGLLPIKIETIKSVTEARFTGKVKLSNTRAFDLGYQACRQVLAGKQSIAKDASLWSKP